MTTDENGQLPIDPTPDEVTPKKRGRPVGSKNATGGDATTPRRRAPSKERIRETITMTLIQANAGIALLGQAGILRQDDRFSASELEALADALTDEALVSPKLASIITRAADASPHVKLASCIVMLALPRLVRRGMLPNIIPGQVSELPPDAYADAVDWRDFGPPVRPQEAAFAR